MVNLNILTIYATSGSLNAYGFKICEYKHIHNYLNNSYRYIVHVCLFFHFYEKVKSRSKCPAFITTVLHKGTHFCDLPLQTHFLRFDSASFFLR